MSQPGSNVTSPYVGLNPKLQQVVDAFVRNLVEASRRRALKMSYDVDFNDGSVVKHEVTFRIREK